jgi:hypothetical protein
LNHYEWPVEVEVRKFDEKNPFIPSLLTFPTGEPSMKSTLIPSRAIALIAASINPSFAEDQAKVDAILSRLGKVCKNKLMTQFPGVPMSDLRVTVGASLKESLDNGSMGLKDLQKSGASFSIEVPGKGSGACGVNAKRKITEFSISKN